MLREFGTDLLKGEIYIGLGRGKSLHVSPDGKTETIGKTELPPEAYFMLPLITRLAPSEFQGPGQFTDILILEETLGSITGSVEDVYEHAGPFLASKGISAGRVAEVLLESSPIKIMKETGQISKDLYREYKLNLTKIITEYYPGSITSVRKRRNPNRQISAIGKHIGTDGIHF